jgi:hypothetical protein
MLKSKKNFIHNFLFISQLDATTKKRLKNIAQRMLLIQKKVVIFTEVIQTRHHNDTRSLTYIAK